MVGRFTAVLALSLALPAAGWTQTTGDAPDCEATFTTLDADGNGFISATESPRDAARANVDGISPAADGLSREEYLQICGSDSWGQATPEAGAPFEGANSFTEEQARERAVAWDVTDVSALVLDDLGIWRGTGMVGGNAVSVAVDFKGNVVTTPATN